jgi:hypothetical protein
MDSCKAMSEAAMNERRMEANLLVPDGGVTLKSLLEEAANGV